MSDLSGDARTIYLLCTAPDGAAAVSAVDSLSPDLRADLAMISPVTFADGIGAPVFLLHAKPDAAIPVGHASLLAKAIGPEVARLTLFGEFG